MPYFRHRKKKVINDDYEPQADEATQALSVNELELTDRTKETLVKGRIATLGDILRRTERDMYRCQNFNKKNLEDVKRMLNARGLSFKPDNSAEQKSQNAPKAEQRKENGNALQNAQKKPFDNRNGKPQQQQNKQQHEPQKPKGPGEPEEWIKYSVNNKFGFKDLTGKVRIQPVYDEIFRFKEGYACFEKQGDFGYINAEDKVVIEPQFECAMSFSEGLASVTKDGKCGYIDKEGNVVIDYRFDTATAFEDGTARVKLDGNWNVIDKQGNLKVIG